MIQNISGWKWESIGDIVTFQYGKGLTEKNRDQTGKIPVYGSNGIIGYHNNALVKEPCLIIGRKGAVGSVHKSETPCWPIDTTYYVIPPNNINLSYLYYLFSSKNFASLDRSTAIPGLNRIDAYSLKIPIPPLIVQEQTVAKIEQLFTQLDAGVAALKRARAALKRYKASVLKAAVEGRLVPQDPSDEPAEEMLRGLGKRPLERGDLPSLPNGWCWTTIGDIGNVKGGKRLPHGHQYSDYGTDYPYVRVIDFSDFTVNTDNLKYLKDETRQKINKYTISKNDTYISIAGSIGKVGVIPECLDCANLTENAAKITDLRGIDNRFLAYVLGSPFGQEQISNSTISTNQPKLALFRIEKFVIPLAPFSEQLRIVAEIEKQLSICFEIANQLKINNARAENLRQAILKQAFEGRLT